MNGGAWVDRMKSDWLLLMSRIVSLDWLSTRFPGSTVRRLTAFAYIRETLFRSLWRKSGFITFLYSEIIFGWYPSIISLILLVRSLTWPIFVTFIISHWLKPYMWSYSQNTVQLSICIFRDRQFPINLVFVCYIFGRLPHRVYTCVKTSYTVVFYCRPIRLQYCSWISMR